MSKFEEIIDGIRNESPDPGVAAAASERVRKQLFGPGSVSVERIRGCQDFQSLAPAYLERALPEARRMLLEDHLRECVACRRAIEDARSGGRTRVVSFPQLAPRAASPWRRWAVAAALAAGIGLAGLASRRLLFPWKGPVAVVQAASGPLYQLSESGALLVGEGRQLLNGEIVQTARGATAVLRLNDGSMVEMNERAQIATERGWRGVTIRLRGGIVIVEAARQKNGFLVVTTADSRVSVKGTIFSVNRGLKGTRVSVLQGAVQVDHGGRTENLRPGQQVSTDASLSATPVADEVSWSRNAARYLALLGEFNALQKRLEAIPTGGIRYSSKLLPLVPADTVLFAAAPNAGNALAQAKQVFDEQLRSSEVLRDWWNTQHGGAQADLDVMVRRLQQLSANLGEEVVFAIALRQEPGAVPEEMTVLAEARGSGLAVQLDELLRENSPSKPPFLYAIRNGILIVTHTPARLAQLEAIVGQGKAPASAFRDRIAQAYAGGAGWLLAANLEQIVALHVSNHGVKPSPSDLGLQTVKYLVLERRETGGRVENQAVVNFAGARQGMPAWLASPGPIATLEFVTPDAGGALAAVTKSPRSIVEDLFQIARKNSERFDAGLADLERRLGLKIVDDLAAPLGSEAMFALDGPLLPSPSWKLAVEVYSPQRLQFAIQKLVESFNAESNSELGHVTLGQEQAGGRLFYTIAAANCPATIHYTYVDNYIVAGASRVLVQQAIQTRQTGASLARSERFRSQLPSGPSSNFSAVIYHNLAGMVGPAVDQLKDASVITPAQRQAMLAARDAPPGVIVFYGEADRITASSQGAFLGVNLAMLANLDQLPQVLLGPGMRR